MSCKSRIRVLRVHSSPKSDLENHWLSLHPRRLFFSSASLSFSRTSPLQLFCLSPPPSFLLVLFLTYSCFPNVLSRCSRTLFSSGGPLFFPSLLFFFSNSPSPEVFHLSLHLRFFFSSPLRKKNSLLTLFPNSNTSFLHLLGLSLPGLGLVKR